MANERKNFVVMVVPDGDESQAKAHAVDLDHTPVEGERVLLDTGKSYEVLRVVDDPAIQVVSVIYLKEETEQIEAVAE